MSEKKIIKAVNTNKKAQKTANKEDLEVGIEAQERLAEIRNDRPRIASLAGTEWEIRTLRQKVQWMIAEEVVKINKIEKGAGYGDVVKQFATNMPSVIKVITLRYSRTETRMRVSPTFIKQPMILLLGMVMYPSMVHCCSKSSKCLI